MSEERKIDDSELEDVTGAAIGNADDDPPERNPQSELKRDDG